MKPGAFVLRSASARKPPHGATCNRCGVRCMATLCDLAQHLFDRHPVAAGHHVPGPCPALVESAGLFVCGVAASPELPEDMRHAAILIIGANLGCDARINGEPRNEAFAKQCVAYDARPDVKAARMKWRMP